jgi:hypothetical protein
MNKPRASRRRPGVDPQVVLHAALTEVETMQRTARDLHRALDIVRALDRDRDLAIAIALAGTLALDLDRALDRARALDRDLARALARALALALARARDLDLDLGRALDRDLDLDLGRAGELVGWINQAHARLTALAQGSSAGRPPEVSAGLPRRVQPSWVAVRVNGWAARLLSPAARALHADELLDEVYDLAELGAPRRAQIACGLRQLAGVRQLRVTARSAKRSPTAAGGE